MRDLGLPLEKEPEAAEPPEETQEVSSGGRKRTPLWRRALSWTLYLLLILGAMALLPRVLTQVLDTPYPLATVSGSSMWPTLKKGDLVVLQGVDGPQDLRPGDIIAFRHKEGLAIHRIVSIEGDSIVTKGDSNLDRDPPIYFDQVVGKIPSVGGRLAKVPLMGYLSIFIGPLAGPATAVLGNYPDGQSDTFDRRGIPIEEVEGAPANLDGHPRGEVIGPARELPRGDGAAQSGTSQGAAPDLSNAGDGTSQPAGTSQGPVPDLSSQGSEASSEPAGTSVGPVEDLSTQEGAPPSEAAEAPPAVVPDLSTQEEGEPAEPSGAGGGSGP